MKRRRTGDDADHQQDHDHQDVYGAFLHVRDRQIHARGVSESSRVASAS